MMTGTGARHETVHITCKLPGFKVAAGNTWWYRNASSPWNDSYYSSADAKDDNGSTSGSLHGQGLGKVDLSVM